MSSLLSTHILLNCILLVACLIGAAHTQSNLCSLFTQLFSWQRNIQYHPSSTTTTNAWLFRRIFSTSSRLLHCSSQVFADDASLSLSGHVPSQSLALIISGFQNVIWNILGRGGGKWGTCMAKCLSLMVPVPWILFTFHIYKECFPWQIYLCLCLLLLAALLGKMATNSWYGQVPFAFTPTTPTALCSFLVACSEWWTLRCWALEWRRQIWQHAVLTVADGRKVSFRFRWAVISSGVFLLLSLFSLFG